MNSVLSILFLIYFAIALSLAVGSNYIVFLIGCICYTVFMLYFWRSYIKTSKGMLADGVIWKPRPSIKHTWVLYFAIIIGFSVLYWLAYYPGGFNLDAYGQWLQAHGRMPYSDWHPLLSTLLIQLVISVADRFEFYIFVQILLFSFAAVSLLKALEDAGVDRRILIVTACFIGINPAIGLNTICLTKDVQYTILLIQLTACFIRIICTRGRWLDHPLQMILLGILFGLTFLVRHNGVLFVVPALLILLLSYKTRILKTTVVCLLAAVVILIVKIPVSQALEVEPHENVVGESVGIPMGLMANALVNDPDNIPQDVHVFLNEMAPDDTWVKNYYVGEWDSCKWKFGGPELLKGVSLSKILSYAWKTVLACPQAAYESIRFNTQIVWEPLLTNPDWIPVDYIAPNDVGISHAAVTWLQTVFKSVQEASLFPLLSCIFWNTGFQIALIMLAFCFRFRRIKTETTLLFLPLLAYDFGTMLLLAGPNQRYFYVNAVLYVPVVLLLLTNHPEEAETI